MHPRLRLRFRVQDQLWWRKVIRIRPHLRHHGLCQEVRAQVQAVTPGRDREGEAGRQKAEEGKEEQDEEGPGHQEGQGWSRGQKGN